MPLTKLWIVIFKLWISAKIVPILLLKRHTPYANINHLNMGKGLTLLFSFTLYTFSCLPPILTYGYDSATSCSPKMSRKGRAQLLASIPCDLTQQAYCNLPGSSYPWHAVRRFVHENQGLMKRMYGDIRHISILRTEIQNNEIDVEDIEATAARYSRDGLRKQKFLHTDYQNSKTNDVLSEPHFRPTTTVKSTTQKPIPAATVTSPIEQQAVNEANLKNNLDNNLESNNILDTSTHMTAMENIKVVQAPNLSINRTESATISTTLKVVQQIIKSEIESEQAEKQELLEAEIIPMVNQRNSGSTVTESATSTVSSQLIDKAPETSTISGSSTKGADIFNEKKKTGKPSAVEGQLFQDTVEKEAPVVNIRGVNACPVKEEVVAPFWANNTRGEVLALLNLYPFEQYVHWEKCTHEHKQMYCRDGCRCEQQFRLHRLLAYDPHNECRGIFSDWFRFPSCCICKCYDIPLEFRATSRSPRTAEDDERKGKLIIERAEEEVRKAIYDHATKDWYRPRDEFELLYD